MEAKMDSTKADIPQLKVDHPPLPERGGTKRSQPSTISSFRLLVLLALALLLSLSSLPPKWLTFRAPSVTTVGSASPADGWKDNIYPLRQPKPWDISTSYPYPRFLEYTVTEGTWLRLDVHPKTGDIVFDILGDIYCLPAVSYLNNDALEVSDARPVLLGVPHDSDPHFSPEGDIIAWRSDAELGVENIWVMNWLGCERMDIRPMGLDGQYLHKNDELIDALEVMTREDRLLASGVTETVGRNRRRLIREGRLNARRVTNETYRWVSDPRFHPSGTKLIATKWYTSSRSLGAGEGWEYPVPILSTTRPARSDPTPEIGVGSGRRLVGRTLPAGWSSEQYGDQQIGPEQFIWKGDDELIYAKNIRDVGGSFTYSKDVHKGIYAIFCHNLTTGITQTLVDAFPGGASRPELSRDGRTLAFVRRVRDKEALVLKDLKTGTIHHAFHGLTHDLSPISAPMGTYPSFAFTPNDDAVIIWAAGQIFHIPLSINAYGERIPAQQSATPIRFRARIEKRLANTVRADPTGLRELETGDTMRVRAFKEVEVDLKGEKVLFQGAGRTFVHQVGGQTERVPTLYPEQPYYSPSFVVTGAEPLVIHARWSDTNFTTLEVADVSAPDRIWEVRGLPFGRWYAPTVSGPLDGDIKESGRRRIALVKTGGDTLTGDIVATAQPGLYVGDITIPADGNDVIQITNLHYVASKLDAEEGERIGIQWTGGKRVLVQQSDVVFVVDLENEEERDIVSGRTSTELAVSLSSLPPRRHHRHRHHHSTEHSLRCHQHQRHEAQENIENVAFVDFYHVYVVPGDSIHDGEGVWSKPGNATKRVARVSLNGGHDATWSGDGTRLFWFLGPYLHSLELDKLSECADEIERDGETFGIGCTRKLVRWEEVVVEHSTDVSRLKEEAKAHLAMASSEAKTADLGALANADVLVLANATVLTMNSGNLEGDLLFNATLVTRGGVIEAVGHSRSLEVPKGASVIDIQGGFVVPGFIDAHAHWDGFGTRHPARSWELETFLAYGVTTLHNPSADNVDGFVERSRVEGGQLVGPRIYQTGNIIYGAAGAGIHQDIVDEAEAYSALLRIKVEGGPASFSYKNYNLPSRASRQRLLLAARNLSMLCVPEGGMNQDWDLTYIIDGMTTVEHPLPVPYLYDDVLNLYALSGTGSTPTHIVNYGGAWGEQLVWARADIPNDPKLRRFTRHDILEGLTESTARPRDSYALYNTSASIAKMVQKGLRTHIGAHGEPPLGRNYHAEMWFARQGGLSHYEVLRAATSDAAITLGLFESLGSIDSGKLADYVVYPPGLNLLSGNITATREILYVARGGRVWDASTMVEIWPVKGRKFQMPLLNPE
ncbi:hypothetical protein JAAARDRAFT_171198 [Jaapia argillacea MUCL 33604]|uniref:Amidohydrolase-related domain-containing protein n=1 Tax=Jaapia argillacea MUCL 33604 TaxID=933084 RepID=A0A067Q6Q0_9AGAM|nr:hypothetical protein JAAARDRAFT_171198 [Jaapia argillacea MUCL 33604]